MRKSDSGVSESALGRGPTRRKFLTLAGAAGITGLAGCGGGGGGDGGDGSGDGGDGGDGSGDGGDGGDGSSTNGTPSDLGSVPVGIISPMTGPYNSLGPGQRNGAKLAVQQINNSDEYNLEIDAIYGDTGTETGQATQTANEIVQQDNADYLFGAISSSVALSLNEFAKSKGIIYFAGPAAVPITGKKCNKWVFRFESHTAMLAEAVSDYTVNNLGSNVWFHYADYAYGQSVYNRTKKRMQEASGDFSEVGVTKSKLGSTNFGSFISQISNSDADVALLGMTGGDLINFVVQASKQGLKDDVAIVAPTMSFKVVRQAAKKAVMDTYGGVRYNAQLETGDNQQFVKAYKNAYDATPDNFERVGYESLRLIAKGMQKAGSTDPADAREALSGSSFTTVLGDITLRACDHQATNPVWMSKMTQKDDDDVAEVELLNKVEGKDALPACGELGCNLS